MKSPEWRWQQRRADLRHFEIFKHEPIIIYTSWGTYYPICTFPASSECLIGISDAFSAFCLLVSVILPTCSLYPQQKRAYSALHPQAWTYMYRPMPVGTYRAQLVPLISEDRLLCAVVSATFYTYIFLGCNFKQTRGNSFACGHSFVFLSSALFLSLDSYLARRFPAITLHGWLFVVLCESEVRGCVTADGCR